MGGGAFEAIKGFRVQKVRDNQEASQLWEILEPKPLQPLNPKTPKPVKPQGITFHLPTRAGAGRFWRPEPPSEFVGFINLREETILE